MHFWFFMFWIQRQKIFSSKSFIFSFSFYAVFLYCSWIAAVNIADLAVLKCSSFWGKSASFLLLCFMHCRSALPESLGKAGCDHLVLDPRKQKSWDFWIWRRFWFRICVVAVAVQSSHRMVTDITPMQNFCISVWMCLSKGTNSMHFHSRYLKQDL